MLNMLSIGKKAVMTSQKQLEVTAHNIANVNTPGYSRQRLIQENSFHIEDAIANWGTGVEMIRVERMRDLQLDAEFRRFNSSSGYWNTMAKNLTELEKNILETTEFGVSANINGFFNAWESLSLHPFSTIHRMDVVNSADSMVRSFQDLYRNIDAKINDVKHQLVAAKDRINQISEDLSKLIEHISLDTADNRPANDLLDRFDLLIDELSTYGNVTVYKRENGTMSVYLGSEELCRNGVANKLKVVERENFHTGQHEFFIGWTHNGHKPCGIHTGSLNALYDLKDTILPGYQKNLDELVVQIAQQVNDIHRLGFNTIDPSHGGIDFFAPDVKGVMSFSLSKEVLKDPKFISASINGASGDNQIALMITDLRLSKTFDGITLTERFADIVYNVGSDVRMAKQSSERSDMLTRQSDNFRDSVKGVSMNEETANLIKFQQSYQAAAKIISVADEMFRTIIGMVR
jgi:flagellar hook-associated protein 1 FlgK